MRARTADYRKRASEHAGFWGGRLQSNWPVRTKDGLTVNSYEDDYYYLLNEWNRILGNKYRRLANRPCWLVMPDPPMPPE